MPLYRLQKKKILMSIFFFQCTVYAVLYRNTSHVVLAGRNIHRGYSRPFWTPSPGFLPSGFRVNSLIFPRGKMTRHPVVFIDVRRAKNEDRLIGLSMLHSLEMCPSSSCFLSQSSWCSLVFFKLFCSVICVKQYTYNHAEMSLFMPFFLRSTEDEMMRDTNYLIDTGFQAKSPDFS